MARSVSTALTARTPFFSHFPRRVQSSTMSLDNKIFPVRCIEHLGKLLFFFHSLLTIELIFADSSKVIQLMIPQRKAVNSAVCSFSLHLTPLKWNFLWNWLAHAHTHIFLWRLFVACHFSKCMTFVATSNRQSTFGWNKQRQKKNQQPKRSNTKQKIMLQNGINTTKCMDSNSVQLYAVGSEQKIHAVVVFLSFPRIQFLFTYCSDVQIWALSTYHFTANEFNEQTACVTYKKRTVWSRLIVWRWFYEEKRGKIWSNAVLLFLKGWRNTWLWLFSTNQTVWFPFCTENCLITIKV